jgi:hypothetical protein
VFRNLDNHLNYDSNRLWGIGVFWFLIGLAIDRRRSGQRLEQQHPISTGVLFTFGALVCAVLGVELGTLELGNATSWDLIAQYPLRSSHSMTLAFVVWLLAFCGYFCKRAFIAARQPSN